MKDGRLHDDVVVWVGALRHDGEVVDSQTSRARLRIPVGLRHRIRRDGFRATSVLRLPPGSYQLRVVVHETGAGRTGSVVSHLEVPKLEEGLLRGVALSSKAESRIPMAGLEGDLAALPGPLSATRHFRRNDELIAYVELLNPSGKDLRLVMALRSEDGRTVTRFEDAAPETSGKSVLVVSRRFPLSELARGDYRLDIRAMSLDGREFAARQAAFAVR